jgi:hypothetical protein
MLKSLVSTEIQNILKDVSEQLQLQKKISVLLYVSAYIVPPPNYDPATP